MKAIIKQIIDDQELAIYSFENVGIYSRFSVFQWFSS